MTMTSTEYRVVYNSGRGVEYRGGFPMPDLNWEAYFHDIRPHQVIRWEKRTVTTSDWEEA